LVRRNASDKQACRRTDTLAFVPNEQPEPVGCLLIGG
jgi:hypothetical protein